MDGIAHGLRGRVHDAREGVDFDGSAEWFGGAEGGCFGDGVCQQPSDDAVELIVGEVALDEIDACGMGGGGLEPDGLGSAEEIVGSGVARVGLGAYLDAVDAAAGGGGWVGVGGWCGRHERS